MWMTVSPDKLILRCHAYWLSLQNGHEEVANKTTITVYIPERQLLNADTLHTLMEKSRSGVAL